MLCAKYMTLYNATQFYRNKIFANYADCHDWQTVYNIIASDIINRNIQNQLLFSLHSFI